MADQRDVQQLIQSLVPASGNAGNPNTAYNNPTPDTWLQGWNGPQVSPAATLGPTTLEGQTVTIPALTLPAQVGNAWNQPIPQLPGIRLPSFTTGGQPGGSWGITRPDVTPTNPVIPPSVQPGTGPVDVGIPIDWDALLGGGGGGGGAVTPVDNNALAGAILGQPSGNGSYPIGGQIWNPPNLGTTRGVGDGSDVLQLIDMITEPVLPGNYWLNGTNQANIMGGLASTLAANLGIPLNDIMTGLEKMGTLDNLREKADSGASLNFLERAVIDQLRAVAENDIANTQESVNKAMDRNLQEALDALDARNTSMFDSTAPAPRPKPSSQAAGATTIAEGAAAQAMFEGMKTNWLNPSSYNTGRNPDSSPSWLRYFAKER